MSDYPPGKAKINFMEKPSNLRQVIASSKKHSLPADVVGKELMTQAENRRRQTMKALTEDDWNEIYYALEDKKRSPACAGDWRWTADIDSILEKIGHDGVFASREESAERLIAAAPDLLEAAKEMVNAIDHWNGASGEAEWCNCAIQGLNEAVKRAEVG